MKKQTKKLLLGIAVVVLMMTMLCFGASAISSSGSCGDNVTYTYNSETGEVVISGSGDMWGYDYDSPFDSSITSVVIKEGVTSIGSAAFSDCTSLTSVTIPDSVTSIGNSAFFNCSSLTSVTISDSVTSIGLYAFDGGRSLENITVDENNEYYESDEYGVLFNKGKTTLILYPAGNSGISYTIPDSVTSISGRAFRRCESLESITIPDSVTSIGSAAFSDCTSLASVTIGNGVTSFDFEFIRCTSLTSVYITDIAAWCGIDFVPDDEGTIYGPLSNGADLYLNGEIVTNLTIPDSVTSIGNYSFYGCTSIENVTIPDSVTSIGSRAFSRCTSLTSVTIPDSVTSIGSSAFAGSSLASVTIPDSVTSIGSEAFYGCTSLASVTIPDSVTSIGLYAFYNTAYYNTASNWEDNVLYIGNHLIEAKRSISGSYEIKEGTITIAGNAFYGCTSLASVTIPDSVTSIGSRAFSRCESLASITIPDSVTSIGLYAFYRCTSLTNVTVGNGVTSIGDYAFEDCYSLTDVYYSGTEAQWSEIDIDYGNSDLTSATIHYSETVTTTQTNDETGIIAEYDSGVFDGDAVLVVSTTQGKANIAFGDTYSKYVSYDIHFELDDETVQPNGSVTVKLPIPDGYNTSTLSVYYIDDEGNATKLSSNVENGYVVFTTDHFSEYAIVDESSIHTHSYTSKVTKAATCTATGTRTYTCTCGDSYTESVAKLGHSYSSSYTVDKKATCTAAGSKSKHCTRSGCAATTSVTSIAKLSHTEVKVTGKAATCTATGLTEGKKCSVCNNVITAQQTISATGHSYTSKVTKAATCTAKGVKTYNCSKCSSSYTESTAKLSHTYKTTTTKATLSKNGSIVTACSVCGTKKSTATVYYPKTITLSKTAYTYDSKAKTPTVTVKDSKGNVLKEGTDYTVKYESGRKLPGTYTVTVTFKGNYGGSKKLTFTIAPKATSKISASQSTSSIKLTWNKVTGATGYRVYKYNSKTKKYEKIKTTTSRSYKVTGLKAGTTYKFKIKACSKVDGTTLWGKSTSAFTTATKPKKPTLKVTSTVADKATLTWTNVSGESGYQVYYSTKKDSGFKKMKSYKTNTKKATKSDLKSGKTYYFKVRAYKKVDGKVVYGSFSSVKSVKIK